MIRAFVAGLAIMMLAACSNAERDAAVRTSMAALQKLEASTQVGVSRREYGSLLIEAQAARNNAIKSLPQDSYLAQRVEGAMKCYLDAAKFWDVEVSGQIYFTDSELGMLMYRGYAGLYTGPENVKRVGEQMYWRADPEKAIKQAWALASIDIRIAGELVDKKEFGPPQH